MAKIYTYVVIALTLQIVLHILGLSTTVGTLINVFGVDGLLTPATVKTGIYASTFYSTIVAQLGILAVVAAVTIGFFGAQRFTVPVTATIASLLLLAFVGDWLSLINVVLILFELNSLSSKFLKSINSLNDFLRLFSLLLSNKL